MTQEEIGETLKTLRKTRRLTLNQASEITGLPRSTISVIENGAQARGARVDTISILAGAYGYELRVAKKNTPTKAAKKR